MAKKTKNIAFSTFQRKFFAAARLPADRNFVSHFIASSPQLHPENLTISYQRLLLEQTKVRRIHSHYVLKIHLQGKSLARIDKQSYILNEGEGILIFPFQLHYLERGGDPVQLRMLFQFDLTPAEGELLRPLRGRPFRLEGDEIAQLLKITESIDRDNSGHQRSIGGMFSELLFSVRDRQKPETKPASGETENDERLDRLFDCVYGSLETPLSIKELAGKLQLSPSHLSATFRNSHCGLTLGATVRRIRINQAINLLIYTDDSLAEIAHKCGFADQFTFSRAFSREIGCPPKKFRTENRCSIHEP